MSSATKKALQGVARLCPIIEANARDVGRQIGDGVHPLLCPGETVPDFTLVLDLPARLLREGAHRLHESQERLDEAEVRSLEVRSERDRAASELRQQLVGIRRHMAAMYSPRHAGTVLGINGATAHPSQSEALVSQAESALGALHDPKRMTRSAREAFSFEPDCAAAALAAPVAELRDVNRRTRELRRKISALREARDGAFTQLIHGLECSMKILSGFLGLSHRSDLANKLRSVDRLRKKSKRSKKSTGKEVCM